MGHRTREDRRDTAKELLAEREGRTDEQQLAHLDRLLGVGVGAKKERARLAARIAARGKEKKK